MRANRTVFALGVLCVVGLAAGPAQAQEGTRGVEGSDARESRHEARQRVAAERRAALLEWHRARRAGQAARDAAPASLAGRHGTTGDALALRTASLERGTEPVPAIAGTAPRMRVLEPAVARGFESDRRGFGHDRFGRGHDGFGHGRGRHGFGYDWRDPWAGPFGSFGLPYGFEELVCIARIRDPYRAGPWGYGPYGRRDRVDLRATCVPAFGFGAGWAGAGYGPYGAIPDPLLYGFPYRAAPLPAPHRFSHRFFPRALDLPWAAEEAWLPGVDDGDALFDDLFR